MNRDQAVSVFKFVSLTSTALFAGGAVYINVAEHPARRALTPAEALIHWSESYNRASIWQAGNAALGFVAGLGATYLTGERVWAASGAVLGSVIPLTLVIIMPVNNALKQGLKKIGSEVQVGSHHHHRHFRPHHHEYQDLHQRAWDTEVNDQEDDEEDMELSASSIMWSLCFGSVCIRGSVLGQVKTLLRTWGGLHAVRSGLGLVALAMLAAASSSKRKALLA